MSLLQHIQGPDGKGWRGALIAAAMLGILAQWPMRIDVTEDRNNGLTIFATNDWLVFVHICFVHVTASQGGK